MHVERTFRVARPPEEVFDYLADFTHTNEWDPGTVETRRTRGTGGLGTEYANTSEFLGRSVELVYETTAHERPHRVQFRGRSGASTATDTMSFSPAIDGTEIHYRADFDFGRAINLVAPLLLKGRIERLADDTVAQLRRTLA